MKYSAVIEWDEEEVATWLRHRHFDSLCESFVREEITGSRLLLLSEKELRGLVSQGITRKRLWRDLRTMMERLDYRNSEAEQTAASLEVSGPDLLVYTHRLVSAGLSTQNIINIHNIPLRLAQAGVHTSLHVFKIKEVLEREKNKTERGSSCTHHLWFRKPNIGKSCGDLPETEGVHSYRHFPPV